jgi:hypothetical protein
MTSPVLTTPPHPSPPRQRSLWRSTAIALGPSVIAPVVVYVALARLGVPNLWALVGSTGVSALAVADKAWRTRSLSTLGCIMVARFGAGVAVALVTGDARLTLIKDPAFTALVALAALSTIRTPWPLTARIRREIGPDATTFDEQWRDDPTYGRCHRRLTALWALGLGVESTAEATLIATLPFNAAVIATRALTPLTLLVLSGWTVCQDARVTRTASGPSIGDVQASGTRRHDDGS